MAELPVTGQSERPTSRREYLAFALICAAAAVYMVWVAATRNSGLRVPPSIAYVVAFVFGLVAVRLLQLRDDPALAGDGFAFLFCAAMTTIGGWIAFGPGPRSCTGGVNDAVAITGSGLACRIPFGVGAAIMAGIAILAAVRVLRQRGRL
jgi:hypothetical protein